MNVVVGKFFLIGLFSNTVVLLWGLIGNVNVLFIFAMLIWIDMMLYAYKKIEKRSLLFAFGIALFVFLMGREFLQQFFRYKIENFGVEINNHLYICLIIVLSSLWISYALFASRLKKNNIVVIEVRTSYAAIIRKIAKIIFYCTLPFALIYSLIVTMFVAMNGYTDYYTEYSFSLSGNLILYFLSKIELIMPLALSIIMASLPSKKEIKWPLISYFIYLILSLGSGQRSTFVLGVLLIFVFCVYMQGIYPEENWFQRKYMLYLAACVPVFAIAGTVINITRFGGSTEGISIFESFLNFFYDQGVTGNIIKRAFEYSDKISDDCVYILEFLHSGLLARVLGIPVYNGNTIEHALYGNSFTHALGYALLGNSYLMGRGTGSSYIAELFFDFSYLGVAIGTIIYAWIFVKMINIKRNNIFTRSLIFSIITQLLWAPRGSYTGFLSFLDAPSTIITLLFIFGVGKLLAGKKDSKYNVNILKVNSD